MIAATTDQEESSPIKLSEQQRKAAVDLLQGLEVAKTSDVLCIKLLRKLLISLYAPQDPSTFAANIFSSPVVAFLALICKSSQGTYRGLQEIGTNIAKMKTCIRLRCLGHLMGDLQKVLTRKKDDDWVE